MPYKPYIERHAEKDLNKIPPVLFTQIAAKIKELASDPHPNESRKIKGSLKDWRLRIGDYRVLYEIDNAIKRITVMRIKHRREDIVIYKPFHFCCLRQIKPLPAKIMKMQDIFSKVDLFSCRRETCT
jgi:mRNA interferase RelE/StbE